MADNLVKALLVVKHEYFMGMTKIKDKKELLAFIKQEDNLKDTFQ